MPVSFFAFPLNAILALLWLGGMLLVWRCCRKSLFVEIMLSKGATLWAVGLFLVFALIIGITGKADLARSWAFVILLLFFQTVLLFVILRGWRTPTATGARLGAVRWRFLLNHVGILIAVASAFWGAPDSQTMRMQAYMGQPSREAFRADGSTSWLPYELTLQEFRMERFDNGAPSMFEADVIVGGECVTLKVNEPYSRSLGEDIYLTAYDAAAGADSEYCIIQIVREPWKYPASVGIFMMIAGALCMFIGGPRKRYGDDD
jgi:hypothetical protein